MAADRAGRAAISRRLSLAAGGAALASGAVTAPIVTEWATDFKDPKLYRLD